VDLICVFIPTRIIIKIFNADYSIHSYRLMPEDPKQCAGGEGVCTWWSSVLLQDR